ncbi:MAG: deoxyribose-phosphate aldolase [Candidatus Hepatoplasma vulgare]|nr:MAG: deoxyribose-phosphate aldolase [Candidatus Hepatoplasma sp.]
MEKMKNINTYIDHTLVSRDPVSKDLDKAVNDAIKYKFKGVCVTPVWIDYVQERLHANNVLVVTVIGFPYGQFTTETKIFEAKDALKRGADELDFIINVSKVHEKDEAYLKKELKEIREATKGTTIKLILETGLLNDEEKKFAAKLGVDAGFNFIKTSTAVGTTGATVHDVELIYAITKGKSKIKASGGIKTIKSAEEMIAAGADRIGTSNGVSLIEGTEATSHY